MTARQLKRAIRKDVIARILAMSSHDRAQQQEAIDSTFPTLPGFLGARMVLLYVSAFPEEFDTSSMIRLAIEANKRLVCPRVNRDRSCLDLFEIADPSSDFEPGTLNILEPRHTNPRVDPIEIDWVLVPGVAYDDCGFRIGRGAGHYDRLLPTLRPGVPRWSLAFDAQWVEAVPAEPHDQPLDGIVSPGRAWTQSKSTATGWE